MTYRNSIVSILVAIVFAFVPRVYAQSCGCEVSDNKEIIYNAMLNLDEDEKQHAVATHLPWGIPVTENATNEQLLHQKHYIINYDDDLRVPTWVAYRLRKAEVQVHRTRTECFRRDPRLEPDATAAFCADYEEPIFDQGHMVPNADMTRTEAAMINTYMYSNIVPQHKKFNQVIWRRLEGYVRDWAQATGEIYVITGAVFDRDADGKRDADDGEQTMRVVPQLRVAIPTHFYKIVLYERPSGFIESMTFLLPHTETSPTGKKKSDKYLIDHLVKIDDIESLTDIDFLVGIREDNPGKETAIEKSKASGLWAMD